ncbi:MAG: hypothetical protein V1874_01325 [Spirochaetota bacterium]
MDNNPLAKQLRRIIIIIFAIICVSGSVIIMYNYLPRYFELNKIPEIATISMIDKNSIRSDYLSLKGDIDIAGSFVKELRKGRKYLPIFNKLVGLEYYYLFRDGSSHKSIFIRTEKNPEHFDLKYASIQGIRGIWEKFDAADSAEIEKLSSNPSFDGKILTGTLKAEDMVRAFNKSAQQHNKKENKFILTGSLNIDIDEENISFNKNNITKLLIAVILFFTGIILIAKKNK